MANAQKVCDSVIPFVTKNFCHKLTTYISQPTSDLVHLFCDTVPQDSFVFQNIDFF